MNTQESDWGLKRMLVLHYICVDSDHGRCRRPLGLGDLRRPMTPSVRVDAYRWRHGSTQISKSERAPASTMIAVHADVMKDQHPFQTPVTLLSIHTASNFEISLSIRHAPTLTLTIDDVDVNN